MELYDVHGRHLGDYAVGLDHSLDVSQLNAGMYLLREKETGVALKFLKR